MLTAEFLAHPRWRKGSPLRSRMGLLKRQAISHCRPTVPVLGSRSQSGRSCCRWLRLPRRQAQARRSGLAHVGVDVRSSRVRRHCGFWLIINKIVPSSAARIRRRASSAWLSHRIGARSCLCGCLLLGVRTGKFRLLPRAEGVCFLGVNVVMAQAGFRDVIAAHAVASEALRSLKYVLVAGKLL